MKNDQSNTFSYAKYTSKHIPEAIAEIKGLPDTPLSGTVSFYNMGADVLVIADISGLPEVIGKCRDPIFAMHIHEGGSCTGNPQDPFANTGMHYNPSKCRHPYHAGDLPPLFSNKGRAWYAFLTSRFTTEEIIGKTVVIHSNPDDFTTQPSGNSGNKIACGAILGTRRG